MAYDNLSEDIWLEFAALTHVLPERFRLDTGYSIVAGDAHLHCIVCLDPIEIGHRDRKTCSAWCADKAWRSTHKEHRAAYMRNYRRKRRERKAEALSNL